ncbi:transglycosylase SLT domain-containing protein [Lamprocystis purpurea]|uniref:transglycosylase SLT domain-containing protein n=1 Tax=Lamprocystis purpurea TaxID=61598 RepID=UPI0003A49C6A|nr:transglycosylase SLT domain-containing protein [Lamprocystis purpurea]
MAAASSNTISPRARRWHWVTYAVGGLMLTAILALGGCGGGENQRDDTGGYEPPASGYRTSGEFPVPSEIEPNVDFWRHVYGIWSRNQVAFHDDEHLGVIYEVVRLPDAGSDGYTESQKGFVRSRQQYHEDRVRELERRVTTNQPLSTQDKELLAKFERAGGTRALYGAADRVRSQRGLRERFRRGMEISGRYEKSFREVMRSAGLPEDLAYLPHVESSYQTNARSSAGAAGVWQFMPATGRIYMKVNNVVDDRYDPIISAQGAARYLSEAHNRLGSWPLAITSYNHGQGGMANAKAQYGHNFGHVVRNYKGKYFKFASRNYYAEFLAAREVAGNPSRYFPEGVAYEKPWSSDRLVLRDSMPADHVARHYGVSTASLAGLNLHWREPARDGRANLPAGTTVWLPGGSMSRVASQPPSYSGSALASRTAPPPTRTAATAMAFQAVNAKPIATVAFRKSARIESEDEPRIAKAEPETAPMAPPAPRAKTKVAKTAPKSVPVEELQTSPPRKAAKAETKTAKADGNKAKTATKTAKAEAKPTKVEPKVAKAEAKTAKEAKASKSADKAAKAEPKTAQADKSAKTKVHVVKPQETLFRVASGNGLSVAELRKLNKMGPNDNSIRPGQKLKVGS